MTDSSSSNAMSEHTACSIGSGIAECEKDGKETQPPTVASPTVNTKHTCPVHSRSSSIESALSISYQHKPEFEQRTAVDKKIQRETIQKVKEVALKYVFGDLHTSEDEKSEDIMKGVQKEFIEKVKELAIEAAKEEKGPEPAIESVGQEAGAKDDLRDEKPLEKKTMRPTLDSSRTSSYFDTRSGASTPRRWKGHYDRNMAANPGATCDTP